MEKIMELKLLKQEFSVCRIRDVSQADFDDEFCFLSKTDEELSLVCTSEKTPGDALNCETGWRCLRIEGVLDFSLIGILSRLSAILAEARVGIFAVSTYNTDYLFVKGEQLEAAVTALRRAGQTVARPD